MRLRKPATYVQIIVIAVTIGFAPPLPAQERSRSEAADKQTVKEEHAGIGVEATKPATSHTLHPDAQWFPDAGLGLFLHWGIS